MFEKLIHLIDKWNQNVEPDKRVEFIYTNMPVCLDFEYVLRYNTYDHQKEYFNTIKFGTKNIDDMYYKMEELYTERFDDPEIEPEKFKITQLCESHNCEKHLLNYYHLMHGNKMCDKCFKIFYPNGFN